MTLVPTAAVDALRNVVGDDGVLTAHSELLVYECDGFVIEKNSPDVAVFPKTSAQVAEIVKICNDHQLSFLPRGAGTSLAGGCLPVGGGVMIVLTELRVGTPDEYGDYPIAWAAAYAIVGLGAASGLALWSKTNRDSAAFTPAASAV